MSTPALMIDTETLSLRPDAVVVQVGLVKADLDTGEILLPPTGVYPCTDLQQGRHVEVSTVMWWMEQDRAVQKSVFLDDEAKRTVTLVTPAGLFDTIAAHIDDQTTVWAWPSTFDMPLLANLFGGKTPWKYNRVRDLKTLAHTLDPDGELKPGENPAAHNAVADADWQMRYLLTLWKRRNQLLAQG
jgi:3' exoribonuclease, RNase T-like